MNILLFIKRKKELKDGSAPIYIRVTVGKLSSEFSSGKSIDPKHWLASKGRAKATSPNNKQLNKFLEQLEYELRGIHLRLKQENKSITAKEIVKSYKEKDCPKATILALYREHNKELFELIGNSVSLNTFKRHDTSAKLFQEYLQKVHHVDDLPISSISLEILEKYKHYLMTVRHNNNNTAVKYLRNLGKILKIAVQRGLIVKSPMEQLHMKIEEVDKDFLTSDELARLKERKFEIPRLEHVKDVFLFCCYTGLAYVDVHSLCPKDVFEEAGKCWIKKARHKTNHMCHIPLLTPALDILKKYEWCRATRGKLLPVLSNQKMNAYLKEIADLAGIQKNLTTHCARHTFATTVTLANHVSMENVSKMLGHTTIKMTQHYARILDSSIAKEMSEVERRLTNI